MQTVYFHDRYSNKRKIGEGKNIEESRAVINNFLEEHNYYPTLWRYWIKDGAMRVDVGSHTESFTIESEDGDLKWEETTNDN